MKQPSRSYSAVMLAIALVASLFQGASFLVPIANAAAGDCQKLTGVTTVVPVTVKDDLGKSYTADNSGQNFFDGSMPSIDGKPVYLAPDSSAACAQRVGDTVYLKGWYWNDNLGWISMYCPGDGGTNRGVSCGFVKYGVTVNNLGQWSGYAWSNAGWIRMSCKSTPGYNDADYCGQSVFQVAVKFGAPANSHTWFPWTYAWTDTLGWMAMDSIGVPWNMPDTIANDPKCITNPDICLREGDNPLVEVDTPDVTPAAPVLTPGAIAPGDDFPVTWNSVKFFGNTVTSGLGAVKQSDVRNALIRNVAKWKPVASRSCGDSGGYLLKFTAVDNVYYCKGDIHLTSSLASWVGNKTIIVEDGNVHIENDVYSDAGQLGIIAIRSSFSKTNVGNIYVYPAVRNLRVEAYADGSVLPVNAVGGPVTGSDYTISGAPGSPTLFGQLYIRGMIVANNSGSYIGSDPTVTVSATDLAALRSVPADPLTKKPIAWNKYFNAIDSSANPKGTYKSGQTTINLTKMYDATKIAAQKATKIVDDLKLSGTDVFSSSVLIQFEPPSQGLGGFEGISGSSYSQTR